MVRYPRIADGPEVDGGEIPQRRQAVCGHHLAVLQVVGTAPGELDRVDAKVEAPACGLDGLDPFGDDLGSDPVPGDHSEAVAFHGAVPTSIGVRSVTRSISRIAHRCSRADSACCEVITKAAQSMNLSRRSDRLIGFFGWPFAASAYPESFRPSCSGMCTLIRLLFLPRGSI